MSYEDYSNAQKIGQKEYRKCIQDGEYPYLPILDEILSFTDVEYEINIGFQEVPLELIVGTKSKGRTKAFAYNFMPLLDAHTEFAHKWINLCTSLQEEGLRDPIKVYEFMNRFYVVEGNKRVSVLKYMDAYSIPCYVTRVVPKRTDVKENKIYYEFLDFYKITGINYLTFSEEGRYADLLKVTGTWEGKIWTQEERIEFNSVYTRFRSSFEAKGGKKLPITVGDALLAFITVFGYEETKEKLTSDMKTDLTNIWDEFLVLTEPQSVEVQLDPCEKSGNIYKNILNLILPGTQKPKIAFFYEKTTTDSSWSYSHELGRLYLENVFKEQIETAAFEHIVPGENDLEMLEKIIDEGYTMIFTTSPPMLAASLKASANHPDVKILNCSLNTSHPTLRTYYARMYEAKFLAGAIAGVMTTTNQIGYIANFPIFGMVANINAFALGAKMVNPHAQIHLDWTTLKDRDVEIINNPQIEYIMDQDMVTPGSTRRHFGLYRMNALGPENLAMTTWHWGKLYEKIVRIVLNGTWKNDTSSGNRAINYWWGMSAGVIDLIYSQNLPNGTKRLVDLLHNAICSGTFLPFSGIFHSQDGTQMCEQGQSLTPEEIITMNWLIDNVVGTIPTIDQLSDHAKSVTDLQGVVPTADHEP